MNDSVLIHIFELFVIFYYFWDRPNSNFFDNLHIDMANPEMLYAFGKLNNMLLGNFGYIGLVIGCYLL